MMTMKSSLCLSHPPSVRIWSFWPLGIFLPNTSSSAEMSLILRTECALKSVSSPWQFFFVHVSIPIPDEQKWCFVTMGISIRYVMSVCLKMTYFPTGGGGRGEKGWRRKGWVEYGGTSVWCFSDTNLNYFLRYFHSAVLALRKKQSVCFWILMSCATNAPRSSIMNSHRKKKKKKKGVCHPCSSGPPPHPLPSPTAPQNSYVTPGARVVKLLKVEGRSGTPC